MRIVITGSRSITDGGLVRMHLESMFREATAWRPAAFRLTDARRGAAPGAVEGFMHGAAKGVDTIGADWARSKGWRLAPVPYDEGGKVCADCLRPLTDACRCRGRDAPRATWGKVRNRLMLHRATRGVQRSEVVVMAVWDGQSGGTAHMIATATLLDVRLLVREVRV